MPYANYSPDEVAARGEQIYEQNIRRLVEPGNNGRFVVIDIETGDYELDDEDVQAILRALAKRPNAVLYGLRIGDATGYRLGGHVAVPPS